MMGLLGAVGSVVGGILGNNSQKDMFNQSMALSREQLEYQKQLHQNQIQWRVEDAKKAGVHPMAALGLSSMSFSPVSGPSGGGVDYNWLGEAGQNIDRAIQQGKTREERAQAQALQDKLTDIQIRKGEADADLAETEAATARYRLQRELFPSPPPAEKSTGLIGGQGDAVKYVPDEVIRSGPSGSVTAGTHPLWTHARTGDFVLPVLSDKLADAVTENKEKNIGAEIAYALSAWNGTVQPPANAFNANELRLIREGTHKAYYYPLLGWRVEPKVSWENFKRFVLGGFRSKN